MIQVGWLVSQVAEEWHSRGVHGQRARTYTFLPMKLDHAYDLHACSPCRTSACIFDIISCWHAHACMHACTHAICTLRVHTAQNACMHECLAHAWTAHASLCLPCNATSSKISLDFTPCVGRGFKEPLLCTVFCLTVCSVALQQLHVQSCTNTHSPTIALDTNNSLPTSV